MKKIFGLLIAVGILSTMVGCGSGDDHDMDGMDMNNMEHHEMNGDESND